ncbi:hemerythrin domain-containing protein [Ideonella sp. YS5]|uniref:hemerythrin domain-containing protein n=1 Tax=Ideonella sp. YS5 TaxID=3453714 RepID=UPI003EEAB92A
MASLLNTPPAAGLDQPFELLAGCHDRVRRTLDLLQRLIAHWRRHGADDQAASAARDVLRYFSVAAPLHHEDEERHVLPLLRASGERALIEAADRMAVDHAAFAVQWPTLAAMLQALADGEGPDPGALQAAADAFCRLHESHLALEDAIAFPAAAARAGEAERAAMSADMAARRGVKG